VYHQNRPSRLAIFIKLSKGGMKIVEVVEITNVELAGGFNVIYNFV
jgi:hypothetical protein